MKKKRVIGGVILVIVGLALVFGWKHAMAYMNGVKATANSKTERIAIDAGLSVQQITKLLNEKGIVSKPEAFLELAEYKGLNTKKFEPGMYEIPASTSYRSLVNGLSSGNMEVEVNVTFNNCKTIGDLAGKVSHELMIDSAELASYIVDSKTLEKYDFTEQTISAMFLPNTYKMYYDTDKDKFVERMAEEFKKFWTPERKAKLKKVGLKSPSQASTLASIVYGEQSVNASEWPIIARLYLNRLNTGMRLQSDPTFKFCWEDQLEGVQRLTFEHRSIDCPYNTYLYAGLPPGPISMPPTQVIDAVLNPDDNDYLYMCAQPNYDSKHNFTKDYGQHAKNAAEFQNWLANELKNQ